MTDTETDADDRSTPDDARGCCGGARDEIETTTDGEPSPFVREPTTNSSCGEPSILEAELPEAVRTTLGRFLGAGSVDTLGEFVAACRREVGGSIDFAHLCHVAEATDHRATLEGETYYFRCFYDAVALAALADAAVDVRTRSPDGAPIEARAVGTDELSVTPDGAVFSFGVGVDAAAATDDPGLEDVYEGICPYVKAFPSREAYERWATEVPAATVAMPLEGATDVAAALVE